MDVYDLRRAPNHPAALLDIRPAPGQHPFVPESDRPTDSEYLRAYERRMGITYLAVDNQDLADVLAALAGVRAAAGDDQYVGAQPLADAVAALLRLES